MKTEKLYYLDSYLDRFTAKVLSCREENGQYAAVLDRTAFFPLGGGQMPDCGTLGGAAVTDVREIGDEIVHYLTSPLKTGDEVIGLLDFDTRFRRMQNHSGEHIVSGIVHKLYGFNNVGFHLGNEDVTLDFDGFLSRAELRRVEYLANDAVYKNVAISTIFPQELSALDYRSKLDLTENVRIVVIDGYDKCACCAPHVAHTGEIGMIKILDSMRYKGGVRCHIQCGFDALRVFNEKYDCVAALSRLLSAKHSEVYPFVEKLMVELDAEKQKSFKLCEELIGLTISAMSQTDGNLCVFPGKCDIDSLRAVVNHGVKLCGKICAAFSGSDADGYTYVAASSTVNMREAAGVINGALCGKGGGSNVMIQGSVKATKAEIQSFFN